jgi:hypothetical protein
MQHIGWDNNVCHRCDHTFRSTTDPLRALCARCDARVQPLGPVCQHTGETVNR